MKGMTLKRQGLAALVFLLTMAVGLAGCGSNSGGTAPSEPAKSVPKGPVVLKVGMSADMEQPDPHLTSRSVDGTIQQHIFSTVAKVNDKGEVVPDLAEKWENPDPGTYVFHLRKGVKFHNGRELTAADVVFSWERVRDPKTASPRRSYYASVDSIAATDPLTVTVKMKQPDASFLEHMTVIRVLARENIADLATKPIGTGPFMFQEWKPGQQVKLVKNPNYFVPGVPRVDELVFQPIPDDEARVVALKTGLVQFIEQVPARYITELESGKNTQVFKVLGFYRDVLHFNTKKKPFDDVRVRQAIAYAVDRERIASVIMEGQGKPTQTLLNPGHWARKEYGPNEGYSYDLDKAKALLTEAGLEKGFTTSIYVDNRFAWNGKMAELMKDSLSQIGITANLQLLEGAQFSKTVITDRNYDMAFEPWNAVVGDPDEFFYRQFHTGEGVNFVNYSNPQLDQLLEKARATMNRDERKALYYQIQDVLLKEQPVVPIQHAVRGHGGAKSLQGFKLGPDSSIWFDEVTIQQ